MRFSTLLAAGLVVLMALPAHAGTKADYNALKAWCIGRNQWSDTGRKTSYPHPKEYFHFHHYCSAMRFMDKYYGYRNVPDKKGALVEVINNLDYVVSHVPSGHFLMAEVYAFRGRAYKMSGKKDKAELDLLKALELDPKHQNAVTVLVDLYIDTNRTDQATKLLRHALALDPTSRALQRRAKKLGLEVSRQGNAHSAPNTAAGNRQGQPNQVK